MSELVQVLTLLCGLDFQGDAYVKCVEKSKQCVSKNYSGKSMKSKGKKRRFSKSESKIFYKCYAAGEVK